MRVAPDGRPEIGPTARTLGVRPKIDILVLNGIVKPLSGGLSVAPDTPDHLPDHRRPISRGGTGKDPIWSIDLDAIGSDLQFRQDRPDHGLIEPAQPMSIDDFQEALARTAGDWSPS
jgi:hypothetical protein